MAEQNFFGMMDVYCIVEKILNNNYYYYYYYYYY